MARSDGRLQFCLGFDADRFELLGKPFGTRCKLVLIPDSIDTGGLRVRF